MECGMDVFLYMPEAEHGRRYQRTPLQQMLECEPAAARLGQQLIAALERGEIVEISGSRTAVIRITKAAWAPCEPPADRMRALTGNPISIHLQGLGEVPGKPAEELRVGDMVSWNNSPLAARIEAIVRTSDHSIWVIERYADGREFKRRFKRSRVVPAETPGGNPDRAAIIRLDPISVAA